MGIALNDGETVSREELNKHIVELYNTFNKLEINDDDNFNNDYASGLSAIEGEVSEEVCCFNTVRCICFNSSHLRFYINAPNALSSRRFLTLKWAWSMAKPFRATN